MKILYAFSQGFAKKVRFHFFFFNLTSTKSFSEKVQKSKFNILCHHSTPSTPSDTKVRISAVLQVKYHFQNAYKTAGNYITISTPSHITHNRPNISQFETCKLIPRWIQISRSESYGTTLHSLVSKTRILF